MRTIVSVAYPHAAVSTSAVGGAEQIVAALDAGLVAAGRRSVVVARADSEVSGRLVPVAVHHGPIDDVVRRRAADAQREAVARILAEQPVDLLHLHGLDFASCCPIDPRVPVLVTLHLPPAWYPPGGLAPRAGVIFNCVSHAQAKQCRAVLPGPVTVVENGVDVERLHPLAASARRDYAVALGRICPEKGFHLALDAARRARVPLLLAGRVFPYDAHERYFANEIVPRLDATRRHLGPARFARKCRLLAGARVLLVPSLAPETSSLAAMEALACGTPVIAFAAGALPEIVDHGLTGFIVRDEREMADAIAAVDTLDREACRHVAETRFSAGAMVARYLALYERLASSAAAA